MNNTKFHKSDELVQNVFNSVFDNYDLMNDIMSFGIHRLWKKDLIYWLSPQKNTKLLDVASGTGDIAKIYLDAIKDQGEVVCFDKNKRMIKFGKEKFIKKKQISWIYGSAEKLPFKNNIFDYYTISFGIRNVVNINLALQEAYRVLKPGGRFICLEFSKVDNKILNNFYNKYLKLIPKIGNLVIGKSHPYEYLVNSIKSFYSQEQFIEKMQKFNFTKIKYRNLSGGIAAIHSGWKI